jgi:hypothetical protein
MISTRTRARKVPIVGGKHFEEAIELDTPITKAPTDPCRFQESLLAVVAERELRLGGAINVEPEVTDRLDLGQQLRARLRRITRQNGR